MADGKWISYLRVSTPRQGRSGLGLEAQRHAADEHLNGGSWKLIKEFVEIESGKKLYAITPEGEAFLDTQAAAASALFARMAEVAQANQGRNAPQILRAMENLRTALRLRMSRGPLDAGQVDAIAAALDAAAKAVEQA